MNKSVFFTLSLALGLCPVSLRAAYAQQTAPPVTPPAPATATTAAPSARATAKVTISGLDGLQTYFSALASVPEPAWLEAKISLDVSNISIADALAKVLDAAKVVGSKIDNASAVSTDTKITLKVENVATRDAIAAIARLGGAGAFITTENDKYTIILRKRTTTFTAPIVVTPGSTSITAETQQRIAEATRDYANAARLRANSALGYSYNLLPSKQVSLDVRNKNVRDTLKTILNQADVDYVLEDDVPENVKKSFTFENVPLSTALDVICQSANVGWRSEHSDQSAGRKGSSRYIVRIGKRYASRRFGFGGSSQGSRVYTAAPDFSVDFQSGQRLSADALFAPLLTPPPPSAPALPSP